jgi:putative transposase
MDTKKSKKNIKSSSTTLKFANTGKLEKIARFVDEYKKMTQEFIDLIWNLERVPSLLPKEITSLLSDTWLSARVIQCAGKQASGIVRGARKKQEKRLAMVEILNQKGHLKRARKLMKIYDENIVSKPDLKNVCPELDSRFVEIDLDSTTTFDGWLTLTSLGDRLKIVVPFKAHKHLNEMRKAGVALGGVRISSNKLTFMFDLPFPEPVTQGKTLGIDVGQITTLSCSDGQTVQADPHGHTFQSICQTLAKKQKGSKAFGRAVRHRTNFIHWSVNQLGLEGIKQINVENLKYIRKGKRNTRTLQHWNYRELLDTLEAKVVDAGVQLNKVSPTYTSQRCSKCGWVRKGNRKSKRFKCDKCGFTQDADLNASINLSLELPAISRQQRLSRINRKGFYWLEVRREPVVPSAKKTSAEDSSIL